MVDIVLDVGSSFSIGSDVCDWLVLSQLGMTRRTLELICLALEASAMLVFCVRNWAVRLAGLALFYSLAVFRMMIATK